jgi:hypothetical protein
MLYLSAMGFAQTKTVNCTSGRLNTLIEESEKTILSKLVLTGTIDARDFKFMRDSMPALIDIDMSATTITAYQNNLENEIPAGAFYPPFDNFKMNDSDFLKQNPTFDNADVYSTSQLKYIKLPSGLVSIGGYAFCCCYDLTGNLVIPNTVKNISVAAFFYCFHLTGALILPNSISHVGKGAFRDCSGLFGPIQIPNNSVKIDEYAFKGCTGLMNLKIVNCIAGELESKLTTLELKTITSLVITGTIDARDIRLMRDSMHMLTKIDLGMATIEAYKDNPANEIPNYAFCDTLSDEEIYLVSIVLPVNTISIGNNAFYMCKRISGFFYLPNTVARIGKYAFCFCRDIKGIDLPNSLESIGEGAFESCWSLEGDLKIPNSIIDISKSVFSDCMNLNGKLEIPNSVVKIGDYAFSDSGFSGNLIIPNSVTSIGKEAFSRCKNITGSLIIPNSVAYIGDKAFSECGFEKVQFFKSTSFGKGVLSGCKNLTQISVYTTQQ